VAHRGLGDVSVRQGEIEAVMTRHGAGELVVVVRARLALASVPSVRGRCRCTRPGVRHGGGR
jgi:hypothetical protein